MTVTPRKTVGQIEVSVELGGWPEQITICYNERDPIRLHYADLRDLEYAVQFALQQINSSRQAKPGDPNYV